MTVTVDNEPEQQATSCGPLKTGVPRRGALARLVWRSRTIGPLLAPLVLAAVFTALNPRFIAPANLRNLGEDGAIVLVVTVGLTYIILMGAIDLTVSALIGLGEVLVAVLVSQISYWAFPFAIGVGLVAGLLNGLVHVRLRIPSFIATLGMGGIWTTIALVVTNGGEVSIAKPFWPIVQWVEATFLGIPTTVYIAAAMVVVVLVLERRTRFGRYIYAIGAGEEAARAAGVPIARYKVLAFGLSGATAGAGGALFSARLLGGGPTAGEPFLLLAIAIVVVGGTALTGGTGGARRTVLGAVIMTILVNGMTVLGIHPFAQQIITGAIMIGAVAATMDRSRLFVTK